MDTNKRELLLKDDVYAIVGAAMEVSSELGCGFLEAVYQEALAIEFGTRQILYVEQKPIKIHYKGCTLKKEYIPDFLCHDQIIVEIKAIKQITNLEEAQLLNYLKASGCCVGVLLIFGAPKLEWKRFVSSSIGVHSRSFAVYPGGN
jgi:GxxExxY protein